MKLSNEVLVSSVSVLGKLNQLELPVKVAFILAKNKFSSVSDRMKIRMIPAAF